MNPLSEPFQGSEYSSHPKFPGRLLVLGESAYLTPQDLENDFTVGLLRDVAKGGRASGGHITYYRKLFFVLTGKRFNEIDDAEWESVWHSLAFYHFIQTPLSKPRERPAGEAWEQSKRPFLRTVAKLQPDFILSTGKQLATCVRTIGGVVLVESGIMKVPVAEDRVAVATYISHPSSWGFRRSEARAQFERLLTAKILSEA